MCAKAAGGKPQTGVKTQSAFLQKLGEAGKKAFETHKNDDTDYGMGGDLPAGIEGGIAQLVECKFDTYKKGELAGQFFFYAAGVVLTPTEHNGVKIEGLRTSIMEPMCATPKRSKKTVDEHIEVVLNELRKLGVDTSGMTVDNLEAAAAAIKEQQPTFRFRTWIGEATTQFPNPRVQHQWGGACEYDATVEAGAGVSDSSGGTAEASAEAGSGGGGEESAESQSGEGEDDLPALAAAAAEGDSAAQTRLGEIAMGLGIEKEQVENAESWDAIVEMINNVASGADSAGEGETEAPWEPAKDEVYAYKPMVSGPGGKKVKAKNAVKVLVTGVDKKGKTVALKNMVDNKTVYTKISWDDLESAE